MSRFPILASLGFGAWLLACSGGGDEARAPAPAAPGAPAAPAGEKVAPIKLQKPTNEGPGFLTAFADVNEVVGEVPHTVKLDVEIVEGTGQPPFTYKWDFGDATEFSTEQSPSHVYKIAGSFRASVIVTDSKGQIDQDYVDITVNEDFDYAVTPEQLREALPLDDILDKAQKDAAKAAEAAGKPAPGKPAAGAQSQPR
jgi:hypothetical protein